MRVAGVDVYPADYVLTDVFNNPQPAPAAGADLSYTVPIGVIWNVVSLTALFTASAGAANRTVAFFIKDQGGRIVYQYGIGTALTANQTCTYTFEEDVSLITASANGGNILEPLPATWLPPDWSFGTTTANIQAGDQWSNVSLWVQAYLPVDDET